jgi:hypothetical protein
MGDVVRVLEEKYEKGGANAWFGHPGRVELTVEGSPQTVNA